VRAHRSRSAARHDIAVAEIIHLQENDGLIVLQSRLRMVQNGRALLVLPWDAQLFSRRLDGELVLRESKRLGLEIAVVSEDPGLRARTRWMGLPTFSSVEEAEATAAGWAAPDRPLPSPPPQDWWEEEMPLSPRPAHCLPAWLGQLRLWARIGIFTTTLLLLLVSAYVVVPRATIRLTPAGETIRAIVPVSVSLNQDTIDTASGLIPARRVGDYFDGYLEVETTGAADFQSGLATGTVLFTNLIGQDITVPAGTVVRTSSGSFPVRFRTTQEALVPALGQAPAPVEALKEGPSGNVGANRINQVEGVSALAVRVTNPEPTVGGATQEVRAVSQADMDRARTLLIEQLLDEAYLGLQAYLESTEFLARQSLTVQASETSYDRFLSERADTLGLHMRVLVSGLAVDRDNAKGVAYSALARRLPTGYELVGADFELGEMAEEPVGSGDLTVFVTATGYAAAEIDLGEVRRSIRGKSIPRAKEQLAEDLPLAEAPRIEVWPEWLNRVPVLPVRIDVEVVPQS